jgi:hypothetical protein
MKFSFLVKFYAWGITRNLLGKAEDFVTGRFKEDSVLL